MAVLPAPVLVDEHSVGATAAPGIASVAVGGPGARAGPVPKKCTDTDTRMQR